MKKQLLLLFAFLCSMGMWAEETTHKMKSYSSYVVTDDQDINWDLSASGGSGFTIGASNAFPSDLIEGSTSKRGLSVNSATSAIKITSQTSFSNVTKVVVYASANGSTSGSVSVKVGSSTMTAPSSVTLASGDKNKSFVFTSTTPLSGKIEITLPYTSSKTVWFGGVKVTTSSSTPAKYDITIDNKITNGTVSASATSAAQGATITLTATPANGYKFDTWSVTNASTSTAITVTDNKFTMPAANVNVSATFSQIQGGGDPVSGAYTKTSLADISANDQVLVVHKVGDNYYALSNDNGTTAAPTAVKVTVSDNSIASPAENIIWNLSYDSDKETFTLNPDGVSDKWLYCTNTNNGVKVGTGEAKVFQIKSNYMYETGTATARYLGVYSESDWRCYEKINANISGQELAFFVKKAEQETPEAKTIDFIAAGADGYYTTFSNDKAVTFPEMIEVGENIAQFTVYTVYAVGNLIELKPQEAAVDGLWYLSENEGYLIKADYTGDVTFTGSKAFGVEYTELEYALNGQDADNALRPASEAKTGDNKYYMLAYGDEALTPATLGFYWGAANGAAFVSREGSAYLSIPASTDLDLAKGFSFSNTQTTGIKDIKNSNSTSAIYNLAGQRVNANTKGIVIMNGKKMFNK